MKFVGAMKIFNPNSQPIQNVKFISNNIKERTFIRKLLFGNIEKRSAAFRKFPSPNFPAFHRRFEAKQKHNKILISNHETSFAKHTYLTHVSEKEQKHIIRSKLCDDRLNGNSALNHIKRLSKRSNNGTSTKPKIRYHFSFVITASLFNVAVVVYKTI